MRLLPQFFVLRSDDLPSENMFSGYYFAENDIYVDRPISGDSDTGEAEVMPRDLEGIYVAVEAQQGEVRVSWDYAGTVPIFLYRVPGFWAVSPSFHKLLAVARARGDRLNLEQDLLQAWRITGVVGQYPRNFQTAVSQVQIVPSYCHLVGTSTSVTLVPRKKTASPDYRTALNQYRTVTGHRFRTIARNRGKLVFDVTGGIDSRSILATALEAFGRDEFLDLNREKRINLRTNRNNAIDFPIALQIAQEIGVDRLIHHRPWSRKNRDKSADPDVDDPIDAMLQPIDPLAELAILDRLAESNLGRRAKLGLDVGQAPMRLFASSGVFGGNLKSPNENENTVDDGRRYLKKFARQFDSAELHARWVDRIIEDVKQVQEHTGGDNLPFWPLFNREFAMRLHARETLGSHRLYPLSSRHLVEAVNHLDAGYLAKNGVHHDLIQAGSPTLYKIAYDKDYKTPHKGFRPVDLPKIGTRTQGQILAKRYEERHQDNTGLLAFDDLPVYRVARARALELAHRPDVRAFIGEAYCQKVIDIVSDFSEENMIRLPESRLSLLHGPLFAEMLLELGLSPAGENESHADPV